jgi:hypothetical protein
MQLDIKKDFSPQITGLKGKQFERIVASCYFYQGYTVFRNIVVTVEKQTTAEIDVLATLITPNHEIDIAVECKGTTPSFNDLRKFSTINKIFGKGKIFVDLFAIGDNDIRHEHKIFAEFLGIKLEKKGDLSKKILPILWGTGELVKDRIKWINKFLAIYTIEDYFNKLIDDERNSEIKNLFKKYRKYLYTDFWNITDPITQINDSFQKSKNEFSDFTSQVSKVLDINLRKEMANPTNQIIQAAMYYELMHRILNLYGILRCTVLARTQAGREMIIQMSPTVGESVNNLCDYNITISKFMNLIFRWVFLWGGYFVKKDDSYRYELAELAKESGLSETNVFHFIGIIRKVYGSGSDMFYNDKEKIFMKYIPSQFRALGKLHRQSFSDYYDSKELFREDSQNYNLLNDSLNEIGGCGDLQIKA